MLREIPELASLLNAFSAKSDQNSEDEAHRNERNAFNLDVIGDDGFHPNGIDLDSLDRPKRAPAGTCPPYNTTGTLIGMVSYNADPTVNVSNTFEYLPGTIGTFACTYAYYSPVYQYNLQTTCTAGNWTPNPVPTLNCKPYLCPKLTFPADAINMVVTNGNLSAVENGEAGVGTIVSYDCAGKHLM